MNGCRVCKYGFLQHCDGKEDGFCNDKSVMKVAWKKTKDGLGHPDTTYLCPKCYRGLFIPTNECPYCGQKILWESGGELVMGDRMGKVEYELR